jgi:hypothetical protein
MTPSLCRCKCPQLPPRCSFGFQHPSLNNLRQSRWQIGHRQLPARWHSVHIFWPAFSRLCLCRLAFNLHVWIHSVYVFVLHPLSAIWIYDWFL